MKTIQVERSNINIEALDATLRTALGNGTTGLSYQKGIVIVHLVDSVSADQEKQARTLVEMHDPAILVNS